MFALSQGASAHISIEWTTIKVSGDLDCRLYVQLSRRRSNKQITNDGCSFSRNDIGHSATLIVNEIGSKSYGSMYDVREGEKEKGLADWPESNKKQLNLLKSIEPKQYDEFVQWINGKW